MGKEGQQVVELLEASQIDVFSFLTSSHSPDIDPVRWRLEGAQEGAPDKWTLLQERKRDFPLTIRRRYTSGEVKVGLAGTSVEGRRSSATFAFRERDDEFSSDKAS